MAKNETNDASKKKRVKKVDTGEARNNYVVINDTTESTSKGDMRTITRAMLIRSVGTAIETTVLQGGEVKSVATTFIHGVKVKTKKAWKFLIVDKGPKQKKDKKAKK